jgi:uncharacterized protein YicC (UPF0701 family)
LIKLLEKAVAFRKDEGKKLEADIRKRLKQITQTTAKIEKHITDKQKKISEATPEIFIEYVKTYHKLTDQMLDHVRVTAVWVNGVFVNYKAWNKEIDDVKTFFQQKDLTSDDTVTI